MIVSWIWIYTDIKQIDIENICDDVISAQVRYILALIKYKGTIPADDELKKWCSIGSQQITAWYCATTFMRYFCQPLFKAIDDDECNDGITREKAYKSFHILADYLEKKKVAGIIYPSTRTASLGKHTQNIVAFCVEDYMVIPGSIRIIEY